MIISAKTFGEKSNENANFTKYGDRIDIMIDNAQKYVVKFDKVFRKVNSVEDVNGNQIYFCYVRHPSLIESFKHGIVHTYTSKDSQVKIIVKTAYKRFIQYNDNTLVVEKCPKGKYTYYPIFIDGKQIAEGVLLNSSKDFSLEFNVYLLDDYELFSEAICMLCPFLYCMDFRDLLSPNKESYETTISVFSKDPYDPNWLKSNFDVEL